MKNYRKTPRAEWIDYDAGIFFITICTMGHIHYFGEVKEGNMILSEIGRIVDYELSHPELHHPEIEIFQYVVMPNHIHILLSLDGERNHPDSRERDPNPTFRPNSDNARHVPGLSKYVSALKGGVSREARKVCPNFGWQDRYHDHLVRGLDDGNRIAEYIANNPLNWKTDCFY